MTRHSTTVSTVFPFGVTMLRARCLATTLPASCLSYHPFIFLGGLFSLVLLYATWHQFGTVMEPVAIGGSNRLDISAPEHLRTIDNSTLGFEKTLAINLPERTDRHDGLVLAAAVSNLDVEFVDGIIGEKVAAKVLPPSHEVGMNAGTLGAWCAHIDAISRVVENRWTTTLILEDDVDWDVRLRTQLRHFASGSNFLLGHYGHDTEVSAGNTEAVPTPVTSPYGDDWDVLWMGHCGSCISNSPRSMLFENDETVPQLSKVSSFDDRQRSCMQKYPQHTRIVTRVYDTTCSLAYAVSQRGARALLYELGLQKLNAPFDNMLRDFCEGKSGRGKHKCVTVLPQLFDHYRRAVSPAFDSDISDHPGDVRDKAFTLNVRWSVRLNMDKILRGETDYEDQWPDE